MNRSTPTESEMRDAFEDWYEKFQRPYIDAVIARGGAPWTEDKEERFRLWQRRYERPAPPVGLTVPDIKVGV